jgi:cysteinyl-tRNA synthetase
MLKLFNTLGGELQEFKPLEDKTVKVYTCGPTLYDYAHIGNLSAYLFADILKRFLRFSGYEVIDVMNLTDVDDKTIRDSQKSNKRLREFTDFYEQAFFADLEKVNIIRPKIVCRATDHIEEMIKMIAVLVDKGFAYKSDDGSVYFKISSFENYGELAGIKKENLQTGASGRVKSDEYEKENASDFVLWKAWDENDGEVGWDSPFGKGRPGWHIECSAMSNKYLGETFDIHTGAIDLIFPHHQNEIAQSEAASGKKFVNFWLHRGFLKVDGRKMSKSLGNFYKLKDIEDKISNPLAFRYLVATSHYRLPLNFTFDSLAAADASLKKIQEFLRKINLLAGAEKAAETKKTEKSIKENLSAFQEAFNDDLGAPQAIASLFDFMSETNKRIDQGVLGEKSRNLIIEYLQKIDSVWGFIFQPEEEINAEEKNKLEELIKKRNEARAAKEWGRADEIRAEIEKMGFAIEDRADSTIFKKK